MVCVPAPWFCSESCSVVAGGEDFLFNYTRAVVWEGPDGMPSRRGWSMADFWRMDPENTCSHQMITSVTKSRPL